MSTDLERRLRDALHADAQRARLVNPDRPRTTHIASLSDTPLRRRPGRRVVAVAAAIAVIAGAALVMINTANHRTTHVVTTPSTVTTALGLGDTSCSLTADQVSEAIGTPVTRHSSESCSFDGGHGIIPSASYGYVDASACTQQNLRKEGFVDAVDGLDVDAYSMRSGLGVSVIFCNGDQPLRVHVEAPGDDLVAATAIAKLTLNTLTGTPSTLPLFPAGMTESDWCAQVNRMVHSNAFDVDRVDALIASAPHFKGDPPNLSIVTATDEAAHRLIDEFRVTCVRDGFAMP